MPQYPIDPEIKSPVEILTAIANDETMPPTARVSAARALLRHFDSHPVVDEDSNPILLRALETLGRKTAN